MTSEGIGVGPLRCIISVVLKRIIRYFAQNVDVSMEMEYNNTE